MSPEDVQNAKPLDGLSQAPSEDRDVDAPTKPENDSTENAMLIVADECINPAEYRGILTPELRVRLDSMTRDYARILTRIDRMIDRSAADDNSTTPSGRDVTN